MPEPPVRYPVSSKPDRFDAGGSALTAAPDLGPPREKPAGLRGGDSRIRTIFTSLAE
jgi:hypothetical protein